ncbi:MAG TPA: hypothetical protein VMJ35_10410 [Dongiaceae bacterium]|nr:hypothetical protein [Dongiaceae bacterium]
MSELPSNWTPAEKPRTDEELERRRSVTPILIVMGVAFALLLGSVLGAFVTCGFMDPGPHHAFNFFAACVMFFLGVFALSVAWLGISLIIKVFQYLKNAG